MSRSPDRSAVGPELDYYFEHGRRYPCTRIRPSEDGYYTVISVFTGDVEEPVRTVEAQFFRTVDAYSTQESVDEWAETERQYDRLRRVATQLEEDGVLFEEGFERIQAAFEKPEVTPLQRNIQNLVDAWNKAVAGGAV